MKKSILTSFLIVFSLIVAFAQNDSLAIKGLQDEISQLQSQVIEIKSLSGDIHNINADIKILSNNIEVLTKESRELNKLLEKANQSRDSLKKQIEVNTQSISKTGEELGFKLETSETKSREQFSQFDKALSDKTIYGIIGILLALIASGFIYFFLRKRQDSDKIDIETRIYETKKSLDEESVKIDNKLVEVLNKQLDFLNTEASQSIEGKKDHSLILTVADRLNSMENNLSRMDQNVRGLKNLKHAVKSIKGNFRSQGYEIIEMLGKEFNDGMKVIPNFITSEEVETGKQIITRVIKPQVNFKGKMIQSAQIEVSIGE